eukprot:3727928-Rhodomonas_salina.1
MSWYHNNPQLVPSTPASTSTAAVLPLGTICGLRRPIMVPILSCNSDTHPLSLSAPRHAQR